MWRVSSAFNLVIFHFLLSVSCNQDEESNIDFNFLSIDRSNYVDPHDILNYDRRVNKEAAETPETKRDIDTTSTSNALSNPSSEERVKTEDLDTVEDPLKISKFKTKQPPDDKLVNSSYSNGMCPASEKPFLGRFIKILSKTLELENKHINDGDVLYIPLLAVVTKRAQFILSETLKGGDDIQLNNLADLDEVLSSLLILDKEKLQNEPSLTLFEMITSNNFLRPKDWLVGMFITSLWLVLWLTFKGFSYSYIVSRSFLPFFIISWFWHWNYMDQLASAKRQSDLLKNSNLPLSCNPEQITVWDNFKLLFNQHVMREKDPCEQYHRTLLTDPTYEVNPFVALFDLLVVVIFQPLSYVGQQTGSFFDSILTSAGLLYKIPVFAAAVAVLLLILVMSFRYEIHLPFFKIRPSTPQALKQPEPVRNLLLEDAIKETTQYQIREGVTLRRSHSRVQAVEEIENRSIEDRTEDLIDIAAAVEELGVNTTSGNEERITNITVTTTRASSVVVEQVLSEDSAESSEKDLKVDNQSEERLADSSLQGREP